ncbi:MAG TPA: SPOR domain-containing protein [Pyrinomonadaceae bacterium]|jgi:cell division septation protein DedD
MSGTGTNKHERQAGAGAHHSAFDEFSRDERYPAVLLLSGLFIAALFFGLGILFDRWTINRNHPSNSAAPAQTQTQSREPAAPIPTQQFPVTLAAPQPSASPRPTDNPGRSFAVLISTFERREDAASLVRELERAGYRDVRILKPEVDALRVRVLFGRFTREEANQVAARMRATGNVAFKNARAIEDAQ